MQFPATLMVALALANPTGNDQERTQPRDALQGEWVLLETADQHRTDRGGDSIRMLIRGNEITLSFGEVATNRGTFTVGVANRVKVIDFKFANGRSVQGIYELRGEILTMCVDDAAKGRPNTFLPHGTQWVEKWKRVQR